MRLLDDENQVLQESLADAGGLAHLTCPTNAQWLAARLGQDFHALKIREHEIPLYSFSLPRLWPGEAAPAPPVMVFSDRQFYRPKETLHLKALARDWTGEGLAAPPGLAGTLECVDARGRSFFSNNVQFSACGACAVDVPLPAGPCGDYAARFHLAGADYYHNFQVAEFQPEPFEVSVQARPAYAAGEKVEIPVSARYYFGQPLSAARVKWTMEVDEDAFNPAGFTAYAFLGDFARLASGLFRRRRACPAQTAASSWRKCRPITPRPGRARCRCWSKPRTWISKPFPAARSSPGTVRIFTWA